MFWWNQAEGLAATLVLLGSFLLFPARTGHSGAMAYRWHALILALTQALAAVAVRDPWLGMAALLTVGVKSGLVAHYLARYVPPEARVLSSPAAAPLTPAGGLLAGILLAFVTLTVARGTVTQLPVLLGVATALVALLAALAHRQVLVQVSALLVAENGVALALVAVARQGLLADALALGEAVGIAALFAVLITRVLHWHEGAVDTAMLRELRG